MAYEDSQVYAKYLSSGCGSSTSSSGCSECGESTSECSDCCPAGLVSVKDENGAHVGCLTPTDAQEYYTNVRRCQPGYAALIKNDATPVFLGCVSESEFATLYATVNPAV